MKLANISVEYFLAIIMKNKLNRMLCNTWEIIPHELLTNILLFAN
jgi:hypothetical protein